MRTSLSIILSLLITQFIVKGQIPRQIERGFLISGVLSSTQDSLTLYLVKRANSMHPDQPLEILDSCWIVNDSFKLIGFVNEPDYYSLLTKVGVGWLPFILENETYFIKGSVSNIWNSEILASTNTISEAKLHSKIVNPLIYELNDMADSIQKYSFLGEKGKASVYSQINKKLLST